MTFVLAFLLLALAGQFAREARHVYNDSRIIALAGAVCCGALGTAALMAALVGR